LDHSRSHPRNQETNDSLKMSRECECQPPLASPGQDPSSGNLDPILTQTVASDKTPHSRHRSVDSACSRSSLPLLVSMAIGPIMRTTVDARHRHDPLPDLAHTRLSSPEHMKHWPHAKQRTVLCSVRQKRLPPKSRTHVHTGPAICPALLVTSGSHPVHSTSSVLTSRPCHDGQGSYTCILSVSPFCVVDNLTLLQKSPGKSLVVDARWGKALGSVFFLRSCRRSGGGCGLLPLIFWVLGAAISWLKPFIVCHDPGPVLVLRPGG
jgi:hypothetical protein